MSCHSVHNQTACVVAALCLAGAVCRSAEIGIPHGNAGRTGYVPLSLSLPLRLQWTHVAPQAPRPAWREPAWEPQRIDFDYAYAVSMRGDTVYYASSSDHAVHALDASSGRERWVFFTDAPVRLAPDFHDGRVLFTSDDGFLYCLNSGDGTMVWRYRPEGIPDERLIGNEQMVSRWAARSGVLIEENRVYATFGMLAQEGVAVCCLDARSGDLIWINDTSGHHFMTRPHTLGMGGVSPQGYLAVNGKLLVVSCGRSTPALFDKQTGRLRYHEADGDFTGGALVMATDELLFTQADTLRKEYGSQLRRDPDVPERDVFPLATLVALDPATGHEVFSLRGGSRGVVSADGLITLICPGELVAVTIGDVLKAVSEKPGYIAHTRGHFVNNEPIRRWSVKVDRVYALLQAGGIIIAGGRGSVRCFDADDGQEVWRTTVEGQVRAMSVSVDRLIVSTTAGRIYCFATRETSGHGPETVGSRRDLPVPAAEGRGGYCIVMGPWDAGELTGLARRHDLLLYASRSGDVEALRRQLHRDGLYGVRVVVQAVDGATLPYTDYVADRVCWRPAARGELSSTRLSECYRVLRPCGGVLEMECSPAVADGVRQALLTAGVPAAEISVGEGSVLIRRGALPGAGEWTHQYGDPGKSVSSDEERVRLPLKAAWFGGLGPAGIVSRHFREPAPLVIDGRCFVPGLDDLTAMSIYNGRLLWQREFPDFAHWPAAYRGPGLAVDHDTVYAVRALECLLLDPATGVTRAAYAAPADARTEGDREAIWEYLAVTDGLIVGTVGRPNLKPQWWSRAYPVNRALFALDRKTGECRWVHRAAEGIDSNAIAIDEGRVCLIDGRPRYPSLMPAIRQAVGDTVPPRTLRALDLQTGAVLWEHDNIVPTLNSLWMDAGVVIATPVPYSRSMQDKEAARVGGGMTAYAAANGQQLWRLDEVQNVVPMIVDGVFFTPDARDLKTGAATGRPGAVEAPLSLRHSMLCSTYSGCSSLAMARFSSLGFVDLSRQFGSYYYSIIRSSCWVNMIPAGGLIVIPEGGSSCQCAYNYKTSMALMSDDRHFHYGLGGHSRAGERAVCINFGAPGDRPDDSGRVWFAYPRPVAYGRSLGKQPYGPKVARGPVEIEAADGTEMEDYGRNPDWLPIAGTDMPWLYACGLRGPVDLSIKLPGGLREAPSCRVTLAFCDLDDAGDSRRFDVYVREEPVLRGLCIAAEAGGGRRALTRTVTTAAGDAVGIRLVPSPGTQVAPIISGVFIESAEGEGAGIEQ